MADSRSTAVDVSVVIVSWNSRDVLADCLESLQSHPPSVPWEVIVVDNGSSDGTVERVRATASWARVIANGTNRGLPAANNQGMVAARGDTFIICNPDVLFRSGAADSLLVTLERHPAAAFAIPRLVQQDGTPHTSAGDLPSLTEALMGRQAQRWRRAGAGQGMWWDGWGHADEQIIGRGHEAAYAVRRTAVEQVGLQDEGFVLDWEGFDWTARMRAAGWEVWFNPQAEFTHLGGASVRQVPFRWIVSSHRGMYRYFAKRSPLWSRPALLGAVAVRAGIKLTVTAAGVATYELGHRAGRNDRAKPAPPTS